MREVEFLPEWYPQTRRRRRFVALQGWLTVIMIAGMGAYLGLADKNIRADEVSLAMLRDRVQETDSQIAEMDKLDVMRRQLNQQTMILNRMGFYVEACSMVHAIDAIMPRQMSLTGLTLDNEEKIEQTGLAAAKADGGAAPDRKLKVKVQGVCPTDVDLANFMTQLSAVTFFEQVNITFAREKSEAGHVMREFEVTFFLNLTGAGN